jgi:hypothetical protein
VGSARELPGFDRRFLESKEAVTRIGTGALGGKAQGLLAARDVLAARFTRTRAAKLSIGVPRLAVLATGVFDAFVERNRLGDLALSDAPDDAIARAFQRAELPAAVVGDLWSLVGGSRVPLAVRSSSLLEDALSHPFAGVYTTKMIPNSALEPAARFQRLCEAIKLVYASTFFRGAKAYVRATGREAAEEKMAVIVQEVVGIRHGPRFYPDVSAVARSYNFYPTGAARPEQGVVSLALGLGKTIVDGGRSWTCSPAHPQASPPLSAAELVEQSQTEFWAVNMGPPPPYDPIAEAEYLVRASLADAEADGVLGRLASTFDAGSDSLRVGLRGSGTRVLDFAPLLRFDELELGRTLSELLAAFDEASGSRVELELALTFGEQGAARLGFLQVRPMAAASAWLEVTPEDLRDPAVVVASERVMGNGLLEGISDVVFVRPRAFDFAHTRAIGAEIAALNGRLAAAGRRYLLIGFGRWGSSDPWLGIPMAWADVSGAAAIVESAWAGRMVEMSQGAHFFHNLVSFGIPYFGVTDPDRIAWPWLESLTASEETELVRHVVTPGPLVVKVDGRSGRGVVRQARAGRG